MKNFSVLIMIIQFSAIEVRSQEFRLGATAGLNSVPLVNNKYSLANFGGRISFHIGGLVGILLAGKFSLQPELLYS